MVPRVSRVVRASALAIRELPYIDAARAAGFSNTRIIFRHMVPNVVAPYLIMLTAYVAQAILSEASLSFLGLGVTEPTASWGLMLSGSAADFYQQAPWMIVFPGLAIMRTALIDRRKRPFGDWPYQPDLIVEDFKALVDALV